MKRFLFTISFISISFFGFSQESMVSLSGGWAWANIDDSDFYAEDPNIKGTGWRINGTYDYVPSVGSKIVYGFSIGYINVSASYDGGEGTDDYEVSSVPFYFAPKFLLGNSEKFKGFLKLMIGGQSASMKKSGTVNVSANDFGFYGGGGAGLMYFVNDQIFLNLEYELAYVTNEYFRNGVMNSALIGIGMKF